MQILNDKLPQDIIDNIRLYVVNEIAYQAINNYYNYLYEKKELYEDFVCANYIYILIVNVIIVQTMVNIKCIEEKIVIIVLYLILLSHTCQKIFVFVYGIIISLKIRYYPNYEKSEEYYDEDEDEDEEYYEYDY